MRLLEAILDAQNRAGGGGEGEARVPAAAHAAALPLVVLSCVDPRLNTKLPRALGLAEDQFIWLRNAGNIITGPLSSTMRSLALACLVKGGREIAVIGHTGCRVSHTSIMELTEAMKKLGIERARLPENLVEYFGLFASERQNVIKAVEFIRSSPLIGPRLPVHGLIMNTDSGRLEWVVNGYQALEQTTTEYRSTIRPPETVGTPLEELPGFKSAGLTMPETQIGEHATQLGGVSSGTPSLPMQPAAAVAAAAVGTAAATGQIGTVTSEAATPAVTPSGAPAGEQPRMTIAQRVGERLGQTVAEKVTEFLETRLEGAATAGQAVEVLLKKIDPNRRYTLIGSDQKRYGPVSGRIVQQWLTDNRIDANTPVQVEGSSIWQTLATLPELKSVRLPPPIGGQEARKKGK
jgi:carbonic anhydrase